MGLKPKDLYKLTFKEYLEKYPDLKKASKDIQQQRYYLYEDERQKNIKRCIKSRKDLIYNTKKTEDNLICDKLMKKKGRNVFSDDKKIFMTEGSYVMNNSVGGKTLVTKKYLDDITCLKKEKDLLDKKYEEKEDYLIRILKGELLREQKIQKVKNKIENNKKKLNKFLRMKNQSLKLIESERYQDVQDIRERQKNI